MKKLEARQRGWEEDEDPERKGAIVFNATSEFCRTLGEIPTYGLAGNREEQEELMVGPRAACLSPLLPSAPAWTPPHSGQVPGNEPQGPGGLGGWGRGGAGAPWADPGLLTPRTLNETRNARPTAALSPTGRRTSAGAPSTWTRRSSSRM